MQLLSFLKNNDKLQKTDINFQTASILWKVYHLFRQSIQTQDNKSGEKNYIGHTQSLALFCLSYRTNFAVWVQFRIRGKKCVDIENNQIPLVKEQFKLKFFFS